MTEIFIHYNTKTGGGWRNHTIFRSCIRVSVDAQTPNLNFGLGATFAEAMIAIQLKDISEIMDDIMADDEDEDDEAASIAKVYISKLRGVQEKVVANIGMELADLANLIADPAIMKSYHDDEICGTLDWLELTTTTEPFDVILEFPEANLEQWRPLMMLMINQLIKVLERRQARTYDKNSELPPVLVMLDEFPRLGKISAIKEGLATLRSRGVTFALFAEHVGMFLRQQNLPALDHMAYEIVHNV